MRFISIFRIVSLLIMVVGLSSCNNFGDSVRKVTYPPDFKYVTGAELRSHMQLLAYELQQLDATMGQGDISNIDQKVVLDILRRIESLVVNLKAGDAGSNHPYLQDFMGEFANTVGQAKIAAGLSPPRYYMAGRISGGCVNCHKVNR